MRRRIKAVLTKEHLAEVVAAYMEFDAFAFDTETKGPNPGDGLNPLLNEVTWISLAGPGRADAIPIAHVNGDVLVPRHVEKYTEPDPNKPGDVYKTGPRKGEQRTVVRTRTIEATYTAAPPQLTPGYVFAQLEPLFFSDKRKIGHNLKFDLKTVAKYYDWWIPPGPYGETTSLHHLLNENRVQYRLGHLAEVLLGAKYPKIGSDNPHLYPFDEAAIYAMRDAKYTWMLWSHWQDMIKEQGLSGVLRMEMDLLPVLVGMEQEGVIIDHDALADLRKALEKQAYDIKFQVLHDIRHVEKWNKTFNIAANAHKAWYIYDHRGHDPEYFTKKTGAPSTAAKHLERYAKKDEMVALLLEHAKVEKVLGTYVLGMEPLLAVDGRLHADFVAYGTVTGRMSCRQPNLQNIPRVDEDDESDRGLLIRRLFVSPPGYSFIAADYDQIEMRVLAHFSKDPTLVRIFEDGLDPHAATAAQVLNKDVSEVTKNERQAAKSTNFLIMYGGGAKRLNEQTKMGLRNAERFLETYWQQFPRVRKFADQVVVDARKHRVPYVTTDLNRRRRLPELRSINDYDRSRAERQAVNAKIQGTAADIIKIAMVEHARLTEGTEHKLVLSVHDELIGISPDDQIEEGKVFMELAMLGESGDGRDFLDVPLRATATAAKRWADAK